MLMNVPKPQTVEPILVLLTYLMINEGKCHMSILLGPFKLTSSLFATFFFLCPHTPAYAAPTPTLLTKKPLLL